MTLLQSAFIHLESRPMASYKGHCTDVVSAEELTHSRIVLTAFSYNINILPDV